MEVKIKKIITQEAVEDQQMLKPLSKMRSKPWLYDRCKNAQRLRPLNGRARGGDGSKAVRQWRKLESLRVLWKVKACRYVQVLVVSYRDRPVVAFTYRQPSKSWSLSDSFPRSDIIVSIKSGS